LTRHQRVSQSAASPVCGDGGEAIGTTQQTQYWGVSFVICQGQHSSQPPGRRLTGNFKVADHPSTASARSNNITEPLFADVAVAVDNVVK